MRVSAINKRQHFSELKFFIALIHQIHLSSCKSLIFSSLRGFGIQFSLLRGKKKVEERKIERAETERQKEIIFHHFGYPHLQ